MKELLKKFRKNHKGFTLVELIIVIAIIAVLAAVLAPQYIKYVDKSRWAADQNSAATLSSEAGVAVTDASEDSTVTLADFTITMNSSGTAVNPTTSFIADKMTAIDANWTKAKVTNKGTAAEKEEAGQKCQSYTITYTKADGKLVGTWAS